MFAWVFPCSIYFFRDFWHSSPYDSLLYCLTKHFSANNVMKPFFKGASLVAQTVEHLPAIQKTWVQSVGWEGPLKKGMASNLRTKFYLTPSTSFDDGGSTGIIFCLEKVKMKRRMPSKTVVEFERSMGSHMLVHCSTYRG